MYPTTHSASTSSGQVFVMAPMFKLCFPALFLAMAVSAQAEEKVVNLYSWADYVAPETLQRFEQETGIHVRYDTFDAPEVLETKRLYADRSMSLKDMRQRTRLWTTFRSRQ
jgi:putrescine transport system substrate-binding protein